MTEWLIDKSALVRLSRGMRADVWANRIERGLVHMCALTRLEVGFSARSGPLLREEFRSPPLARLIPEYLTPAIEDRAFEVQSLLADIGQHRAASIPDLMVAATGELTSLTILHQDKDFDLIASITGQPAERLEVAG